MNEKLEQLSQEIERAQLYTGRAGALRPAGGFLRKAKDFPLIFNLL